MSPSAEAASPVPIIWEPQPKQQLFLSCPDWEVLYGGAAGGGKSDAMLVDGWCFQSEGAFNKNHRAVIFRKTFPDLRDLIDRSLELFPKIVPGCKYHKTEHTWTSPAGAKFEFAYCENEMDRFKYRGRAWNWIGFEELTLWATIVIYQYIKGRCRTTDPSLPRLIRATTNPDGPGQKWVMEHWGIQPDGGPSVIVREEDFEERQLDGTLKMSRRKVRRRFIPARLADNRFFDGTGYRETLLDMAPEDIDALFKGLWTGNRVRGAYYVNEMQKMRHEGRLRVVPHLRGTPVNTFWDIGHNDTTALWFHQYAALQNRFLLTYEASGEYLDHFAALLQQLARERGYIYGTHYLPHDAESERLMANGGMGKSVVSQLKALLPGHTFKVVPRIDAILNGIQMTRAAFPTCWMDPDDCADGIAALDAYRKKWDNRNEVFTDEPVHDRFSNYADAFRMFGQGFAAPNRGLAPSDDEGRSRRRAGSWKSA